MTKTEKITKLYDKYVLNTYKKSVVPLVMYKAKGSWVQDIEGKKYLDFFPGWAVSGLGHCHKEVVAAIKKQADKILHVSNNYYSVEQAELAETLCKLSFEGKVFFANSGAEANEAAIKLARAYGQGKRGEIITMEKSFHGRTMATIAATGQDKVKKGFEPMLEGFKHIKFNDIDALKNAISDKTIAIMLELVQGEGGINIASQEYISQLRKICDEKDMLLMVDEVQTGIARTGKMFAFQHYGIIPDVMTLAKSLGGGLPIGAAVVREKFAGVLKPGMHASTFGGSPIACAAALGVFKAIKKEKLLANTNKMAKYFSAKLKSLKRKYSVIKQIKQIGVMIGVELTVPGDDIALSCLKQGLLINCTQGNILRMVPAVTVNKKEIDTAVKILDKVLESVKE